MAEETELQSLLGRLGHGHLKAFFVSNPSISLYAASTIFEENGANFTPAEIGKALKVECLSSGEFRFFAQVALFTALCSLKGRGWGSDNCIFAGRWISIIGEEHKQDALRGWCCLKDMNLPNGWLPSSIFDPVVEMVLNHAIPNIQSN